MTLRSGETHTADGIIGADGALGMVRQILMEEEGVSLEDDVPTGLAIYRCVYWFSTEQDTEVCAAQLFQRSLFSSMVSTNGSTKVSELVTVSAQNRLSILIFFRLRYGWGQVEVRAKILNNHLVIDGFARSAAAMANPVVRRARLVVDPVRRSPLFRERNAILLCGYIRLKIPMTAHGRRTCL